MVIMSFGRILLTIFVVITYGNIQDPAEIPDDFATQL